MSDLIRKITLASLGILSLTKEKAEKIARDLVRRGELAKKEQAKFIKDLMKQVEKSKVEAERKIEKIVQKILTKLNIPTRKELDQLKEKVDKLAKKIK